jgi:acetyl esterase/lipase
VTCGPLSDEGIAYAKTMKEAGVSVTHLAAQGQIHTSLMAVDMVISGAPGRKEMGVALRQFFGVSVPT